MPADQDSGSAQNSTVFVSYSRADQKRARPIIDALVNAGYPVWWDGMLTPGERFANSTQIALEGARAVVVLWSVTSVGSHWVHDEATRGRDRGVLVPLSLDGTRPPLGFGQFQTYDMGTKRAASDPEITAMLQAVAALHDDTAPQTQRVPTARSRISRRAALAGGGVALAATAGGSAWWLGMFASNNGNSVAVLPFSNLGGDPDGNYFSVGLATEVRSQLAAEPLLAVAAQTSSNTFRDGKENAIVIASKLRVAYILEGSVRRDGDRVRIAAELLEGKSGLSRWAETFDRKLEDVFAVQEEIAAAVVAALTTQMALGGVKGKVKAPGGTTSFAAYEAYLQGIDQYDRASDRAGDELALASLEKAIKIDPGYAMARAARSRSLTVFGNQYDHGDARRARYAQAVDEARKAVEIAPALADAQSALGFALFAGNADANAARDPFARSYQLGLGNADVLARYALYEARCGRISGARTAIQRAAVLDPLNARAFRQIGEVEYCAREWAASIPPVRRALEINPDMSVAHAAIGLAQLMLKDLSGAEKELAQEKSSLFRESGLAILALRKGEANEATKHLDALVADNGDNSLYQQAQVLAQWGKIGQALDVMDAAYKGSDSGVIYSRNDPFVDPLRKEQRFIALLKKLGFN